MATSLVGALGAKFPDTTVLFDDDFTHSPDLHGWEGLYSGEPQGVIGWDQGAMVICLENNSAQISTAIKRITHWERFSKVQLEVWCSLTPWYTSNGNGDPKVNSVEIGFDQANNAGTRNYMSLRRRFLESDGTTVINRYELKTGTASVPSWSPLPGQGYPTTPITGTDPAPTYDGTTSPAPVWPPNEGKRNRVYLALEIDPVAAVYKGAKFNSRGWGSMDTSGGTPDDLASFAGQSNSLVRFANGLNACIDFRAITAGSKTGGTLNIYRVRCQGTK